MEKHYRTAHFKKFLESARMVSIVPKRSSKFLRFPTPTSLRSTAWSTTMTAQEELGETTLLLAPEVSIFFEVLLLLTSAAAATVPLLRLRSGSNGGATNALLSNSTTDAFVEVLRGSAMGTSLSSQHHDARANRHDRSPSRIVPSGVVVCKLSSGGEMNGAPTGP